MEHLSKAEELKLMIIENFIDWYWSDENDRCKVKEQAYGYVAEDHVNELEHIQSPQA